MTSTGTNGGPLAGVRVIEFVGIGAGPFGAMLLSDLGADVVRVHRPPTGPREADGPQDPMATITDGVMARGRRSVCIDLKHPAGVEVALHLVAGADALLEGFRPGVMERLGLGPDACLARNPRLVYGRITGWGQEGPYAQAAGHDLNYIALAGALATMGRPDSPPAPPLNLLGDFGGGGLLLAFGVLAALLEARQSGRGQVVDAAMVDGAATMMTMMYELLGQGTWTERRGSHMNDGGAHFYDTYETADGKFVSIAPMEPKFYVQLLERIGLPADDLPEQWDPEAWPALSERFATIFRQRTRDQWCDLLEGTDACFAPVLEMSEAPSHPHSVARRSFAAIDGIVQPAPAPRFSRTPCATPSPAASRGQHTDEVLAETGLDATRIDQLRADRVIA